MAAKGPFSQLMKETVTVLMASADYPFINNAKLYSCSDSINIFCSVDNNVFPTIVLQTILKQMNVLYLFCNLPGIPGKLQCRGVANILLNVLLGLPGSV